MTATANDPTLDLFNKLTRAFDYFNDTLFNGDLPKCLILVARKRGANGYFWADVFRKGKESAHELTLNPDVMDRSPRETLGTLVHEMAHLWQEEFGKPGKNGYHNRQWCEKMIEIGLDPVSRNGKGMKGTGTRVSHEIVKDGPFDQAFELIDQELTDLVCSIPAERVKRPNSRHKLVCGTCKQAIYGTKMNEIKCAICDVNMVPEEDIEE